MTWIIAVLAILWFAFQDRIISTVMTLTPEESVAYDERRYKKEMEKINKKRVAQGLPELVSITDYVEYKQYLWEKRMKEARENGREPTEYDLAASPRSGYEIYLAQKRGIEKRRAEAQKQKEEEERKKTLQTQERDSDESFYDSCL